MALSNKRSGSHPEPTLTSDLRELRFTLGHASVITSLSLPGVIDVGEGGRLLGLEVDLSSIPGNSRLVSDARTSERSAVSYVADDQRLYLAIMGEEEGGQSRSASLPVEVGFDAVGAPVQLTIARRGTGYEITYPSGNR
jgi:hypothetical protein